MTCLFLFGMSGCDEADARSSLKGQGNSTFTFYGLAVDEHGRPLGNAEFSIEVEAIPPHWTFRTRGKPHVFSTVTARSGPDGRFQVDIVGHILRFKKVERAGYRHFYDMDTGDSDAVDNTFYQITAWSDLLYKTHPDHPAVYVFVKDGMHEVSALPCRGGFRSYGKRWILNKPAWPKQPSLKDVVHKPPTTTRATSRP